jgi:hypothetical protein
VFKQSGFVVVSLYILSIKAHDRQSGDQVAGGRGTGGSRGGAEERVKKIGMAAITVARAPAPDLTRTKARAPIERSAGQKSARRGGENRQALTARGLSEPVQLIGNTNRNTLHHFKQLSTISL